MGATAITAILGVRMKTPSADQGHLAWVNQVQNNTNKPCDPDVKILRTNFHHPPPFL